MASDVLSEMPGLLAAQATGAGTSSLAKGTYMVSVTGTWNGATVQLQYTLDGGATWVSVSGATLSANGAVEVDVGAGSGLRLSVSGSPTAIVAYMQRVF